jgi:CheY-like chemotaxis protein
MTLTDNALKCIFLADDDVDDRMLFIEALKEIDEETQIITADDGEHLMAILDKKVPPKPTVIFLDLNMPRKNGLECLKEIKINPKFEDIPVVVVSTSCRQEAISQMYAHGASYYICKPDSFLKLKQSIQQIFAVDWSKFKLPTIEEFVIAF